MDVSQTAGDSPAQPTKGSSFYIAMRILPRAQREAMFEIYAFCRQVDDIADSGLPGPQSAAQLDTWRHDIDALYAGQAPHGLGRLQQTVREFALDRADFNAVIDGMEMDARGPIRAPDLATLDLYCDRVASAAGRLSVQVFGMNKADGTLLSHHLGRALQLTNILRDLDEDADMGRLYLPREWLREAGIESTDPETVLAHPALDSVCRRVAARAREHFETAEAIMNRTPRRQVRTPRVMGEVYRSLLERMIARGWSSSRDKISVSKPRLIRILLQYAIV